MFLDRLMSEARYGISLDFLSGIYSTSLPQDTEYRYHMAKYKASLSFDGLMDNIHSRLINTTLQLIIILH